MKTVPSFFDPCWSVRIYLLCPATMESFGFVARRFAPDFEDIPLDQARCMDTTERGAQAILIGLASWDAADPDWQATVAHECFHATEYILHHRGILHCEETSEVFAYLLDSLVRRCLIILNKPVVGNPVVV